MGMIPILLAPACVAACCLQVAVLFRANPNVGPRGRDRQALDSSQNSFVGNGPVIWAHEARIFQIAHPPNAGPIVARVNQARGLRRAYTLWRMLRCRALSRFRAVVSNLRWHASISPKQKPGCTLDRPRPRQRASPAVFSSER